MNRSEFDEIVQAVRAKRTEDAVKPEAKNSTENNAAAKSEHNISPLDVRKLVEDTLNSTRTQEANTAGTENTIRANAIADAFTRKQDNQKGNSYIPNDLLFDGDAHDADEANTANAATDVEPNEPGNESTADDIAPAPKVTPTTTTSATNLSPADSEAVEFPETTAPASTLANTANATNAAPVDPTQDQLIAVLKQQQAQIAALTASLQSMQASAQSSADDAVAKAIVAEAAKAEAEAAEKAAADAKAKAIAEAEAAAQAKAKAEAAIKAEAEAQAKAMAEKVAVEEKAKAEAKAKAKAIAEATAMAKAKTKADKKANDDADDSQSDANTTTEPEMGLLDIPAHVSLNNTPDDASNCDSSKNKSKNGHDDDKAKDNDKAKYELSFDDLLSANAQVAEESSARLKLSEDSSKYQVNAVALMRLVHLIEPVLSLLCETYTFERSHVAVSLASFNQRLQQCFIFIEQQCAGNLELKRAYADIERPLYFFIDYFVHESKLSFSDSFTGLGRKINEFSGDEKFFELLDIALKENHANDKNYVFFLFMALGFQGSLKKDTAKLQHYMRALGTRLETKLKLRPNMCLNLERLTRDYDEEGHKTRKLLRNSLLLKRWMWASVAVFALAFGINNVIYHYTTRDFQLSLDNTIAEMFNYVKRKGGSEYMLDDAINSQRDSSLMTDAMERFQADSNDFIGNFVKSQRNDDSPQPPAHNYYPRSDSEVAPTESLRLPDDQTSNLEPPDAYDFSPNMPDADTRNPNKINSYGTISTVEITPYDMVPGHTRID